MSTPAFKKLYLPLISFLLLYISINIDAQVNSKKIIHPLMGSISLSVSSGITIPFTDYTNSNIGFIWKGSAGYYFNTYTNHFVGFRIFGGTGTLKGSDNDKDITEFNTPIHFFGAGVNYGYRINNNFFPSLFAGLSYLHFNPEDKNGNDLSNYKSGVYSNNDVNLNFELGLQYLIADQITFDLTTGIALNFNDWLDDSVKGKKNDIYYTLMFGIHYLLLADIDDDNDGIADFRDACPDTPIDIKVDEFGCPVDLDHDNVPNYLDKCPETPAGVKVDSNGCPIDTDLDGIPNYLDRCPNTAQGIRVNHFGCPVDSDNDGVPDYIDKCFNTPPRVIVDKSGCPVDLDGDLIPDYLDKCPGTPDTLQVDASGCPIDSDKDGVADYLDKCLDTSPDSKVTSEGCLDEFYQYVFNAATLFKHGEAILTTQAYKELEQITKKIELRPDANWRIEGHTDNIGSYEYNKKLSLLRAEAVYNYFVSKGIPAEKFEVIGRGEDFPISDNRTEKGRSKNRRVVLIRVEN